MLENKQVMLDWSKFGQYKKI